MWNIVYRSGKIEQEISNEKERKNEAYSISEYLMAENFPELMEDANPQIKESQAE